MCEDWKAYIYNNAATVKQGLAFIGEIFMDDIESLPRRLVQMCPKNSWTGPGNLADFFLSDAVGGMRAGTHSRPMMDDLHDRCAGSNNSSQQACVCLQLRKFHTYNFFSQACISG